MVVLHIANIKEDPFNGLSVSIPQQIISQQKYCEVGMLNLSNYCPVGVHNYFYLGDENFDLQALSSPFNTPDLIVIHGVYDYGLKLIEITNHIKMHGIKYVLVPHGELSKTAQSKKAIKKSLANILVFNRIIKKATAIQYLSEKEMNNSIVKSNKIVATNGVEIPNSYKDSFRKEKIVFNYIGRLEVYIKGIDIMIGAIAKGQELFRDKEVVFNIYGPDIQGRLEEIKQIIVENDVSDLVVLHNEVSGQEKEQILLDTDIFIQTSRTEGMPMGILEALSYGIPCLVTRGTNLDRFIEETNSGWVADNSVESVYQQMVNAIEESESLMNKSINGRNAVCEHFAWDKVSQQTLLKYKKL